MSDEERKGLRFEVGHTPIDDPDQGVRYVWEWTLIGADGPVCRSADTFSSEKEARSNIAASKGRMKATKFAKTYTIS